MRYFLIAGERSGDLHGSNLINALRKKDPAAVIAGYGGDMMESAGMNLLSHYQEGAFMGFIEVLFNLKSIARRIKNCKSQLEEFNPDVVILIDYPGFNLRMAKYAKERGIRTVFYISPKIWAWKKSRIHQIKKYVDQMLVIFPFEVSFYDTLNYSVNYVGNPLVEQIASYQFSQLDISQEKYLKRIAFLPGSRTQEVKSSIPFILQLAQTRTDWQILVTAVDNLDQEIYKPLLDQENIRVVTNQTYEALKISDAAVVTSGTATLETALLEIPQVVCYKANPISYAIGKRLIQIKFISLINLIMDKAVVKELIQQEYNISNILDELNRIFDDKAYQEKMLSGYKEVKQLLGTESASQNAANLIAEN